MSVANSGLSLSDITTSILKSNNEWTGANTFYGDTVFEGQVFMLTTHPVQFTNGLMVLGGNIDCSGNINCEQNIDVSGNITCAGTITVDQPLTINYNTFTPTANQIGYTSVFTTTPTTYNIPINQDNLVLCVFGINAGVWNISIFNEYISTSSGTVPLLIQVNGFQYSSCLTFTSDNQIVGFSAQCITTVYNQGDQIELLVVFNQATFNFSNSASGNFIITQTRLG